MDFDTHLEREFKGRRILIIAIDTCDNYKTKEVLGAFEELRKDLQCNFRIVFAHYGRPTKAHFELSQWIQKTGRVQKDWLHTFAKRLREADEVLLQTTKA